MNTPSILIGMPLFEGWDVVAETLESIRRQDYSNYRVLISVDGPDERSQAACDSFLTDPRFHLVAQPRHIGWEANTTWLAENLVEDFFCYWQHDDVCEPAYLQKLIAHAILHPEASAVYCDMQHFGEKSSVLTYPSVTGFALNRVMTQISQNSPVPIRCLIRADAMRAALPIVQTGQWAVALAAAGELHRVPEILYRRRITSNSLSVRMRSGGVAQSRAGTLEWGVSVFRAGLAAIPHEDAPRLLLFVVDQLINHRPRRKFHYDAMAEGSEEVMRFVLEFLHEIRDRCEVVAFPELLRQANPQTLLRQRLDEYSDTSAEALVIRAMLSDSSYFQF
jgi:glycosyltransferase involved in cell wall biosynthesis